MVGGAGGDEFVVAFLEVSSTVEELLFEFGDSLTEGAGFVGSGESGVVDDLCAKDFGQPLGELGEMHSVSANLATFTTFITEITDGLPCTPGSRTCTWLRATRAQHARCSKRGRD